MMTYTKGFQDFLWAGHDSSFLLRSGHSFTRRVTLRCENSLPLEVIQDNNGHQNFPKDKPDHKSTFFFLPPIYGNIADDLLLANPFD